MTDDSTFDPWATTTGLVDDVTVTITDAYFAFDPGYNDGQTLLLKILGNTDDPENPEFDQFFPCGNGWETADKGATATREDGKKKGFNRNSGYGMFFMRAIQAGAGDVLKSRGTPMEAAVWKGLTFHMKRESIDFGGEIGKKDRILPDQFFPEGIGGSAAGTPSTATPAGTRPGVAAAETAAPAGPRRADPGPEPAAGGATGATGGTLDLTVPMRAKLKVAARNAGSHDGFIEAAYAIEGVEGNPALEEALLDPNGLYAELLG